ncbi:Hypothetical protein PBC10988_0500 [Planctomycetales bacterium 10988]|nr:Hypothetical protein PBC10988_0500 [Planctomycetales bacterium 10988]
MSGIESSEDSDQGIPLAKEEQHPSEADPIWFYASDNEQKGPFSKQVMKEKIEEGVILPDDLVWKQGMPDWVPAKSLTELFDVRLLHKHRISANLEDAEEAPVPPPKNRKSKANAKKSKETWEKPEIVFPKWVPPILAEPWIYAPWMMRVTGRVCLLFGVLIFLISIPLLLWGMSWFTGFAFMLLIFVLGEMGATLLEALSKLQETLQEQTLYFQEVAEEKASPVETKEKREKPELPKV